MIIREAIEQDIPAIFDIRLSVKENQLSDPTKVTVALCEQYLFERGKGWVAEVDQKVVGFAIIDLQEQNVWALFVYPDYEKQGIGKTLHQTMLDWYFSQGNTYVWLSTDPQSRAAIFYENQGWRPQKILENGELKFEMVKWGH